MTSQSTLGVGAAAWYADPCDRHELRYWDGEAWTGHVSDHGQTSVDPVVASAPSAGGGQPVEKVDSSSPETVLKSIWATDGTPASTLIVHLTNKRLVVEPTSHEGTGAMGWVPGLGAQLIAAQRAQSKTEKKAGERILQQSAMGGKELDGILSSVRRAYAINYADIATVVLSRKYPAHGISKYGRCKITSTGRNVSLMFHRELSDEVSAILTDLLPGRITVK